MQSKIYGVKSNAARAAQAHGLTRADLIAVSGGWCFNIPSECPLQQRSAIDGAGETLTSEPAVPADEPIEWGGYDYMVVNGVKPVELSNLVEHVEDGFPSATATILRKTMQKITTDVLRSPGMIRPTQ
jgi:hypothetical protein